MVCSKVRCEASRSAVLLDRENSNRFSIDQGVAHARL